METTLSILDARAESLDALLSELTWSLDDLNQFIRERRAEKKESGVHTLNGNAKGNFPEVLKQVLLRKERLPISLCVEIAGYFDKKPVELFISVEPDEQEHWGELEQWLSQDHSRPVGKIDLVPLVANQANDEYRPGRKKRLGGDPELIKARARALDNAIASSKLNHSNISREITPVGESSAYYATLVSNWRTGKQLLPEEFIPKLAVLLKVDEARLRNGTPAPAKSASAPSEVPQLSSVLNPSSTIPVPVSPQEKGLQQVAEIKQEPLPQLPVTQEEAKQTAPISIEAPLSRLPLQSTIAPVAPKPAESSSEIVYIPINREGVLCLLRAQGTLKVVRDGNSLVCTMEVRVSPDHIIDLFS